LTRTINLDPKQPLEKRQKSSDELSQVKTTTGQNSIHAITVSSLKMIPL